MLKKLCQCFGIGSLILVINFGEFLDGGSVVRMHVPLALTWVCLAHVTDVVLLSLALFAVLAPLQRTRIYRWIRLLLAMLIPPFLVERIQSVLPFDVMEGLVPLLGIGWAALLLLLLLRFPRWYRRAMGTASWVCAFLALFALTSVGQLLYVASWKPGPQASSAAWEMGGKTGQGVREHARVVWILFDELSYDQVFGHRARDLRLDHFDALREESTLFTNVQPAGYHTVEIVPSLLGGRSVVETEYDFRNRLHVRYADEGGWHLFDGRQTVFGDAARAGWRTAAVGWFNPYCGLYPDIEQCYWTNWDKMDGPMVQRAGFWRNTWAPLAHLGREVRSQAKADRELCSEDVRNRLTTHLDLESHMMEVLQRDEADFVFLHFAVPHSPNIWSRMDDDYAEGCDSSYLDNLALADREVGKVMAALKSSPRWGETTVIVEGDHSWRIDLWNWLPAWTEEDDAASSRGFDPRPALLVHTAGQSAPGTVPGAWPLIGIHGVVERLLRGEPVSF